VLNFLHLSVEFFFLPQKMRTEEPEAANIKGAWMHETPKTLRQVCNTYVFFFMINLMMGSRTLKISFAFIQSAKLRVKMIVLNLTNNSRVETPFPLFLCSFNFQTNLS